VIDDAREHEHEKSAVVTGHPDNGRGGLARPRSALQQK
jgi:hypothetical protein